jgi:hypothetical protein
MKVRPGLVTLKSWLDADAEAGNYYNREVSRNTPGRPHRPATLSQLGESGLRLQLRGGNWFISGPIISVDGWPKYICTME